MRRIAEGQRIDNLWAYSHGVAKLVLHEAWRQTTREEKARARGFPVVEHAPADGLALLADDDRSERQQACLETCLETLSPANRTLILSYYTHERSAKIEARRRLAEELGTEMNALRVRAHRIRTHLEACVWKCVG